MSLVFARGFELYWFRATSACIANDVVEPVLVAFIVVVVQKVEAQSLNRTACGA